MGNQLYLYVASVTEKKNQNFESKAFQNKNFGGFVSKATSDLLVHENKCTKQT